MSRKNPIRSSQLVMPAGVGAMISVKGKSLIVAGLDSWFPETKRNLVARTGGGNRSFIAVADDGGLFDESEFVVREPRLEARLAVGGFRRPPDYRESRWGEPPAPNFELTVSVLRFPQWNFCARCGLMEHLPLTHDGKVFCRACRDENFFVELVQMSFVAICERGHVQDFPYREWVHRRHRPACDQNLYYVRTGSRTMAGQKIKCACGAARSLLNIDKANYSDTHLSFYLSPKDGIFFCRGHRPWVGEVVDGECTAYLRGNPRNAGNVWFPQTMSAINLPQAEEEQDLDPLLREFCARADVRNTVGGFSAIDEKYVPALLRVDYPEPLAAYDDRQILKALEAIAADGGGDGGGRAGSTERTPNADQTVSAANSGASRQSLPAPEPKTSGGEVSEADFRHQEFLVLRDSCDEDTLLARRIDLTGNLLGLATCFSRLVQVHRLRETRAFTGFSRIFSDNALPLEQSKAMLRHFSPTDDWLPATTVFGEGIYLELDQERVARWLEINAAALKRHLAPIESAAAPKHKRAGGGGGVPTGGDDKTSARADPANLISPVFILLHTLAHLLIRQLTFECGYGASALRERIYFSERRETKMAGFLIYTADGDSEGTLGGLVRLGTPEILKRLLKRGLLAAERCSHDPFCTEIGISSGQGPGNCNLAACHACALLPETSCEEFNRFLDRALLVTIIDSVAGYFDF